MVSLHDTAREIGPQFLNQSGQMARTLSNAGPQYQRSVRNWLLLTFAANGWRHLENRSSILEILLLHTGE